jgi:hypothetical protein
MWRSEHTLETTARPQDVWKRLEQVDAWPRWDGDLDWARLPGPFALGAQGSLKDRGGRPRAFRITALETSSQCTVLVRLPFAQVLHTHIQAPCGMGTRMTHRVEIQGPLSWLYGWARRRRLREGLAPGMRMLARMAALD